MQSRRGQTFALLIPMTAMLLSCAAERFEPQVQGVAGADSRLLLRSELASDMNRRVDQVALAADQVSQATNQLMSLFPNLRSQINLHAVNTLATVISSLKEGLGADENTRFLRTAHAVLDFLPANDPCREVDLLVEGQIQEDEQLGPEIRIHAKTCSTDSEYQLFMTLSSKSTTSQKFSIQMKPFEIILGTAIAQVQIPPECEVEMSDEFSLDFLKCTGLQKIHQGKEMKVTLDAVQFDRRSTSKAPLLTASVSTTPSTGDCFSYSLSVDRGNQVQSSQTKMDCSRGQ